MQSIKFGNQRCRKKHINAQNQLCVIATLQITIYLLLYLLHHSRNLLDCRSLPAYCCIFSITHAIFYFGDLYLLSSPSLMQFATLQITTCLLLYLLHHSCNLLHWRSLPTYCYIFSITDAIFYFGDLYLLFYLLHHSCNLLHCRSLPTYCFIFSITHAIFYFGDL